MRTRHAVPRGERQFMVADILDIIYRAHSHRLNCQIPCHPSFWPEGLWLPQTPTSLIMLLINLLAACRSSAWVLFNSLARSCEGKPLESSQQHSPGTVHPTGTPPNRAVLRDTHCQQLSADSWEQWLSGIRSVRKRGRLAKPRAAQSSAVTQHGAAELLQGPEGLPAEMQRETISVKTIHFWSSNAFWWNITVFSTYCSAEASVLLWSCTAYICMCSQQ